MAGRGPTPKDPGDRQRRNATVPMTELVLGGTPVDAPKLPGSNKMVKATRDWYATWCASPNASQFTVTDWSRLFMLAKVVDMFHRTSDPALAKQLLGEIRLNETELGATVASRQRLRWTVKRGEPAASSPAAAPAAKKGKRRDPRLRLVK